MLTSGKRGYNLSELLAVICILCILALITTPMYLSHIRRARVTSAVTGAGGVVRSLQAWYHKTSSFSGVVVSPDGILTYGGGSRVGVTLPCVDGVTWTVEQATQSNLVIGWHFDPASGCVQCDGRYCLECDVADEKCWVSVELDDPDLDFDKGTNPNDSACS